MDINWTSLLTGVAGGIIPAAVAYFMGLSNIEASLRINSDKIKADRIAQEKSHKYNIYQIAYTEKKNACIKYLTMMSITNIVTGDFNEKEIKIHLDILLLYTNTNFYKIAHTLFLCLQRNKTELLQSKDLKESEAVSDYRYNYEILVNHTKKLLWEQQPVPLDS